MWGLVLSVFEALGISPLAPIASLLGTTLPALNLLFSILMAYPLAVVYDKYLDNADVMMKHLYIIGTGLDIAWFNFGLSIQHSLIAVAFFYVTLKTFGPGRNHSLLNFIFNMGYLTAGYYNTESENYDITWTMPHCVLVLKLIGCGMDLWDGTRPVETLSENNKKTALANEPTLVELFGFSFFPAAYLVGPQVSMRRYKDMVEEKYPKKTSTPSYVHASIERGCLGLLYISMYQVGSVFFTHDLLVSQEFDHYSFVYKHVFIGLWGKFVLYKYVACWLLTEASCIRFGIAYNGKENGAALWTGSRNIILSKFELATKFGDYIESFNVNTNFWVRQYVFTRLRFLGNRFVSQFMSLLFLAIWHGMHCGYYMTFLMEFLIMFMEKEIEPLFEKLSVYKSMWASSVARVGLFVFLKLYTVIFMGYCLIPFELKVFSKWWHVYYSLYFSGFILFMPWAFVYKPLMLKLIKK